MQNWVIINRPVIFTQNDCKHHLRWTLLGQQRKVNSPLRASSTSYFWNFNETCATSHLLNILRRSCFFFFFFLYIFIRAISIFACAMLCYICSVPMVHRFCENASAIQSSSPPFIPIRQSNHNFHWKWENKSANTHTHVIVYVSIREKQNLFNQNRWKRKKKNVIDSADWNTLNLILFTFSKGNISANIFCRCYKKKTEPAVKLKQKKISPSAILRQSIILHNRCRRRYLFTLKKYFGENYFSHLPNQ